jgi:PAS domain S-box-containing protein
MKDLNRLSYEDLRKRLEALHAEKGMPDELRYLIHELEIHQVELEMQNRELREAQASLVVARDLYLELYDGAPVGYVTLMANGTIRELNLAAASMIGKERGSLAESSLLPWLAPSDRRRLLAFLRRLGPETSANVDLRLLPQHGGERNIRVHALRASDPRDAAQLCHAAMIDVTDQEQAESALREADKRKDEFLMMLGHELRNPLAPVLNAAEALSAQAKDPGVRWAAEIITRQAQHMRRLVDDLLDVSRITHGHIQLDKADFDLRQAVESAVEQARPQFDARRQPLRLSLPACPIPVHGDAVRLAQLISNLLTNASKFSPAESPVWLSLGRLAGTARLWVRDWGVGISRNQFKQIFEPFTQGSPAQGGAPGGLGIGLSLARGLARLHGGSLEVNSQGPGHGSMFTLRLPLAEPAGLPKGSAPKCGTEAADTAEQGLSILIVDDNRDVAESSTMLLSLAGHSAHAVSDGEAALAAAEALHPDVILLDIGLPGMDGFEVARRLRDTPLGAHATLLAVSGYDLATSDKRERAAVFDGTLLKPVSVETLLDTIQRCRHRAS